MYLWSQILSSWSINIHCWPVRWKWANTHSLSHNRSLNRHFKASLKNYQQSLYSGECQGLAELNNCNTVQRECWHKAEEAFTKPLRVVGCSAPPLQLNTTIQSSGQGSSSRWWMCNAMSYSTLNKTPGSNMETQTSGGAPAYLVSPAKPLSSESFTLSK